MRRIRRRARRADAVHADGEQISKEECHGIHFIITDWDEFRSFDFGLTWRTALVKLHMMPVATRKMEDVLGNEEVYRRTVAGDDVSEILNRSRRIRNVS